MIRHPLRGLVAVAAAGITAVALTAAPSTGQPTGGFGAPVTLSGSGAAIFSPVAATLDDGTTAVAWSPNYTSVQVRIRAAGSTTWRATMTRPISGGNTISNASPVDAPIISLLPAGPGAFLLGWTQTGSPSAVEVVTLPANAVSIPAPVKISGADTAMYEPRFATTSDGSAAAVWRINSSGGYDLRSSQRVGVSGAWSTPQTVGTTSFPYGEQIAIDSSRSTTVVWTGSPSGSDFEFRVRSRVGGIWGLTLIAGQMPTAAWSGISPTVAIAAAGPSTVIALLDDTGGPSDFGPNSAVGVRMLTRANSAAPWQLAPQTLLGPGRFTSGLAVVGAAGGGAVVRFTDLSDGLSGTPPITATTEIVQRTSLYAPWSAPVVTDEASAMSDSTLKIARLTPSLAPDGAFATPTLRAITVGTDVKAAVSVQVRSRWAAPLDEPLPPAPALDPVSAIATIDAAGRTTLAFLDPTLRITAISSALPKPFLRARARLGTAAPEAHVTVGCASAWTDAATFTYGWLRDGHAIANATHATYTPSAADRGHALSCSVRAANAAGATGSSSAARVVH